MSLGVSVRYRLLRRTFLVLAVPLFRLRIDGAERIPVAGPGVLVAAHRSWLDPACVAAACSRPVSFLILEAVSRRPCVGWLSRAARAIPVPSGGPAAVRGTREALRRLARGELVGVFPEGRVFSDTLPGELRRGAAVLAVRGKARVVPLHIHGSAEAWPRGRWPRPARVRVVVGEPFQPDAAVPLDRAIDETMRRIGEALGELRSRAAARGQVRP